MENTEENMHVAYSSVSTYRQHLFYFSEAHSCRHLQILGKRLNKPFGDGVYEINPDGKGVVKTICDMSRDGGGWTLLVASYTNKWNRRNVLRNNEMDPKLKNDYSILCKADDIKNSGNVKGASFEYRLEADSRGKVKSKLTVLNKDDFKSREDEVPLYSLFI